MLIANVRPDPSGPRDTQPGLYLADVKTLGWENLELPTIEAFDALVTERNIGYVMFGFYGYPRHAVADLDKARKLVVKLLSAQRAGARGATVKVIA